MLGLGKKKEEITKAIEINEESGNSSVLLTLEGKDGKICVMEDIVRINKYKYKLGLTGKWDSSKITKTYDIPRNTITQVTVIDFLNTHQLRVFFSNAGLGGFVDLLLINKEQKAQAEEINAILGLCPPRAEPVTECAPRIEQVEEITKPISSSGENNENGSVLMTLEGKDGKICVMENIVKIDKYKGQNSSKIAKTYNIPRNIITQAKIFNLLNMHHTLQVYFPNSGSAGGFVDIGFNDGTQGVRAERIIDLLGFNPSAKEPKRLKEIRSQIARIDPFIKNEKEIKELPGILHSDEVVENIVSGSYKGGLGVLVATNKRLVFVDKGMLIGIKVEDFPYDRINSIQYETGMLMGTITIHASGNKADIHNVANTSIKGFAEFVRLKISSKSDIALKTAQPAVDMLSQLERLAKLKDQGILTDEEFNEQKAKILNKL